MICEVRSADVLYGYDGNDVTHHQCLQEALYAVQSKVHAACQMASLLKKDAVLPAQQLAHVNRDTLCAPICVSQASLRHKSHGARSHLWYLPASVLQRCSSSQRHTD